MQREGERERVDLPTINGDVRDIFHSYVNLLSYVIFHVILPIAMVTFQKLMVTFTHSNFQMLRVEVTINFCFPHRARLGLPQLGIGKPGRVNSWI